ncbi:MAG: C69 family dipeptidase [Promethearchaeota archaeon]
MCDTIVALNDITDEDIVIFAKNSDRDPNEPHELVFIPKLSHDEENIKCTYISIPQVEETNAVFLSKPSWIWGCEMGVNEHGVAMGNEAVFTKTPAKDKALLGMDLMRLSLERGKNAKECLEIITNLLEKYGQGGNAGYDKKAYYNNSFLIADSKESWVLETTGRSWVAEKVKTPVRSISNGLTIETHHDLSSADVKPGTNFKKKHSDFIYTKGSKSAFRHEFTQQTLLSKGRKINTKDLFALLRSHHLPKDEWNPSKGSMADICMHAGLTLTRPSQTTSSIVVELHESFQLIWYTATSAPCTSVFKPFCFTGGLPDLGMPPSKTFDDNSSWWHHELLHREIIRDYQARIAVIEKEREELEKSFLRKALEHKKNKADPNTWRKFSEECLNAAKDAEDRWLQTVKNMPITKKEWKRWSKINKKAGIFL